MGATILKRGNVMLFGAKKADICLLVEGSYPYVRGGVSSWVHELIRSHKDYSFTILTIQPDDSPLESRYALPDNVINVTRCALSNIPDTSRKKPNAAQERIIRELGQKIISFVTTSHLPDLQACLQLIKKLKGANARYALLNSPAAWDVMLSGYDTLMPQNSFLDYFWSFRALLEHIFAILLTDIPPARLYHTTCTGYAGLLGARAHLETGSPLMLTEHGIYTNERRVELLTANWLYRPSYARNYNVNRTLLELRDMWIGAFTNYSRICYEACSDIITLYQGNQLAQAADGAPISKLRIIPNGIDCGRFAQIERHIDHAPTVAFIGRVVPIKDVKTFIRACTLTKSMLPDLHVYIIGPCEEDIGYYEECREMVAHLGLAETITFTGNANLLDYLPLIDVVVLTSISEAQPLVLLEAGAAGIPAVATKVGACKEIILGKDEEFPALGHGGIIVPVSHPAETAQAMHKLLSDAEYYSACSHIIQERVRLYYNKQQQDNAYQALYDSHIRPTD